MEWCQSGNSRSAGITYHGNDLFLNLRVEWNQLQEAGQVELGNLSVLDWCLVLRNALPRRPAGQWRSFASHESF
jgi:hypothetical protein